MSGQELPTRFGAVIEASVRVGEMSERRWMTRVQPANPTTPHLVGDRLLTLEPWFADRPVRGHSAFPDSAIVRDQPVVVWFAGVGGGGQA